jgi:hypothetical protein
VHHGGVLAPSPRRSILRAISLLAGPVLGVAGCGGTTSETASSGEPDMTVDAGTAGDASVVVPPDSAPIADGSIGSEDASVKIDASTIDASSSDVVIIVDASTTDAPGGDGATIVDASTIDASGGDVVTTVDASTIDASGGDVVTTVDASTIDASGGDVVTTVDASTDDSSLPADGSDGNDGSMTDRATGDGAVDVDAASCTLPAVPADGELVTKSTDLDGGCSIALDGTIRQVAYEPTENVVYGIDAVNRALLKVELGTGNATYRAVTSVPNAFCVSMSRSRVFVVNGDSTTIDEFALPNLDIVRRISWPAPSYDAPGQSRFQIYCGAQRLYVVDSGWGPGLWTIEDLDGCPSAVDHSAKVSGVGALVLSADEKELYYWYQYGRVAGYAGTSVYRIDTATWGVVDQTNIGYTQAFYRDPLDTPILWDTGRKLIFAKNRVLSADSLTTVLTSFTDPSDKAIGGTYQNAYAIDPATGRIATRHNVFSEDTFASVAAVTEPTATQIFFSADGRLRMLAGAANELACQTVP